MTFPTSVLLGKQLPGPTLTLIKQVLQNLFNIHTHTQTDAMAARANTELEVLLYQMYFIFLSHSASFSLYPAEKPRMNNILTSQTEPYDLSFSRSFQNLTHLPPSYEMAIKAELSKYSFPSSFSTAHPVCV